MGFRFYLHPNLLLHLFLLPSSYHLIITYQITSPHNVSSLHITPPHTTHAHRTYHTQLTTHAYAQYIHMSPPTTSPSHYTEHTTHLGIFVRLTSSHPFLMTHCSVAAHTHRHPKHIIVVKTSMHVAPDTKVYFKGIFCELAWRVTTIDTRKAQFYTCCSPY